MKIYLACPTGERRDKIHNEFEATFGACVTPYAFNSITIKKFQWFFDNGAYKAYQEKRPFDHELFLKKMWQIESHMRFGKQWDESTDFNAIFKENRKEPSMYQSPVPDFVVLPDIVSGGDESLCYSREWYSYLSDVFPEHKYYLAVQDDMDADEVEVDLTSGMYQGIFVGGTKKWKYETSEMWTKLAHKYGRKCHLGGIGTRKSILWAKSINADSVDSGISMIHTRHLREVLTIQDDLFWGIM